jgi:hypothetical protein
VAEARLQAMGYDHVRFFGGEICDYDGSFASGLAK